MASAAVAIGVGEIVAAVLGGTSPIGAVGALVIALQPPNGKDLMVSLFGTNDKLALEVMVFIGGVLLGSLLGLIGRRDVRLAYLGFVAVAIPGFVLVLQDPLEDLSAAAITIAVSMLGSRARVNPSPMRGSKAVATPATGGAGAVGAGAVGADADAAGGAVSIPRRGFLAIAGTFVAVGAALAVVGRVLGGQEPATAATPVSVPRPSQTLPPVPASAELGVPGLTPIVVPNDDFYQIDTRLSTPRLDASTWSLRIHGMVDREVTLTYAQLLAMPLVEQYVTIACVSNEVGGRLVGNAKWTGVTLNSVLAMAGVQPGATQLVGHSYDGWTSGFPTEHLGGAGKDAMIVLLMNGEPLPPRHGYPARMIIPGLYGYVSATKWVTELELTTLEAFDAYWIRLGWAKEGPILTQSRIDTPRSGQGLTGGQAQLAGVAWAPTRGVAKVEVELDGDRTWHEAQLSTPLSNYAWVQWQVVLPTTPGLHTARVRATDGTGTVQESRSTPPAPDGARGYHTLTFSAS